jgi:acyl carrier protein
MSTTQDEYLTQIAQIISIETRKNVQHLDFASKLEDLGLDSLARVRVLVAIERKYGVDINED